MATTSNVKTVYIIVYVAVYCPSLTHKTHKTSQTHVYYCFLRNFVIILITTTTTTTVLRPFFRDHPGETVPKENFWTLWCKGGLTEADTLTIRLGATPSGLTSAYLHHPAIFLQAGCPSCRPTNSIKALKAFLLINDERLLLGLLKTIRHSVLRILRHHTSQLLKSAQCRYLRAAGSSA